MSTTDAMSATWTKLLAPYGGADAKRSVWQLVSAALRFAASWALMYFALGVGYWLTLILAVPAAFCLIRLFIIQHDCGHGAFFKSSRAADITGSILGVLTLTPYHYSRKTHALHHATSGNHEHPAFTDITTLPHHEYAAPTRCGRFENRPAPPPPALV